MNLLNLFKKKQPPRPLDRLRIVRLEAPLSGDCGVCGHYVESNHFDRDLLDVVCGSCHGFVRDAEIQLRAFVMNTDK